MSLSPQCVGHQPKQWLQFKLRAILFFVTLCACAAWWWSTPPHWAISESQANRIKVGMTRKQVEEATEGAIAVQTMSFPSTHSYYDVYSPFGSNGTLTVAYDTRADTVATTSLGRRGFSMFSNRSRRSFIDFPLLPTVVFVGVATIGGWWMLLRGSSSPISR